MAGCGNDARRPHLALIACNPVAAGGMQTFSRGLLDTVLREGWQVTVALSGLDIYSGINRDEEHAPSIDSVEWLDNRLAGDRAYRWKMVADRYRWFRRVRPDVALFIQSSNTPYRAAVLGAWLAGVPIVTTHRTMPWPLDEAGSRRHLFGLLPGLKLYQKRARFKTRLTAWPARYVVYNSHNVRAGYEELYRFPAHKGVVIANALDPALLEALTRQTHRGAAHDTFTVGYIGRLGGEKRVDVLIRAVATLNPASRVRLHIHGDGPDRPNLERLVTELNIAERVCFHGETRDVVAALASMDAFVMPSARESSSNAVLEAQAAGLPVIVSDAGGLPELVEHGRAGLVVPAGDEASMAAAIELLLCSPHLAHRLGRHGRQRTLYRHHPSRIGREWLHVLECAAQQKRRQPLPEIQIAPVTAEGRPWPGVTAEGRA